MARAPDDETANVNVNSGGEGNDGVDTTPLLGDQIFRSRRFMRRPPSLRGAARFLRRASSRRMMREPSMRVREAAAEQIEERQSDWAYSKPIVLLDLFWNLAFVVVSVSVLVMSRDESPMMPLRLWIVGASGNWSGGNSSSGSDGESGDYGSDTRQNEDEDETSTAKHLESANTMFSFIWWIIGFYWVSAGGERLPQDSPQLYWLCITFLAFDVFFVVICVAVACVIGIAVCCCLPCIIAILYAVADQEGATKEDIERLPKYKFKRLGDFEKQNGEIQESFGGVMTECDTDSPIEHVLPPEDALMLFWHYILTLLDFGIGAMGF
nr:E3 ubiquitin-protein ligase At1g63170-like [Ipomoea batatas]